MMDNFRSGRTNILVATTVIAEGVDVPECNGVIRYLYLKDVIAEVQMPGLWSRTLQVVQSLHNRQLISLFVIFQTVSYRISEDFPCFYSFKMVYIPKKFIA